MIAIGHRAPHATHIHHLSVVHRGVGPARPAPPPGRGPPDQKRSMLHCVAILSDCFRAGVSVTLTYKKIKVRASDQADNVALHIGLFRSKMPQSKVKSHE